MKLLLRGSHKGGVHLVVQFEEFREIDRQRRTGRLCADAAFEGAEEVFAVYAVGELERKVC